MMASVRISATSSGVISGSGLAMAKMIGFLRHRLHHVGRQRALGREAEEDVGAVQRLGQRARLGLDRMRRLPLVHAFGAALVDDALGVAQDDVFRRKAHRLDQLDAGDAGRAGAVADELGRLHVAAGDLQRVDQAGGGDDRGAVLVVVEDRECPSARAAAAR